MADPTGTLNARPGDSTNLLLRKILLNLADLPGTFITPAEGDARYLRLIGGTLTGPLTVGFNDSPDATTIFSVGADGAAVTQSGVSYGGNVVWRGFAAGGTRASPTFTPNGTTLAGLTGGGWFNGAFSPSSKGGLLVQADGTWSNTSTPTRLTFIVTPAGSTTAVSAALALWNTGSLVLGAAAIATDATGGFLYIPSCAGTPTGTPTTYTGRLPLVIDSTNHKLYFYSGGAWRDAGP